MKIITGWQISRKEYWWDNMENNVIDIYLHVQACQTRIVLCLWLTIIFQEGKVNFRHVDNRSGTSYTICSINPSTHRPTKTHPIARWFYSSKESLLEAKGWGLIVGIEMNMRRLLKSVSFCSRNLLLWVTWTAQFKEKYCVLLGHQVWKYFYLTVLNFALVT